MWCRESRAPFAVRAASHASRPLRTARSPIACMWTWNPSRVQRDHRLEQLVAIDVRDAGLVRLVAGGVAVGPEHRPRVVLEHAVAHDLHGRGVEACRRSRGPVAPRAPRPARAAMPIPPERADHASGELAPLGERPVRLLGGRRDPGVLPSRDAEGVEVLLREEDRSLPLLLRGGGRYVSAKEYAAPSCSVPVGSPVAGSRSIRPSQGSGVSRVMCATSSAFEFTHAPWTSRFRRKTGRSGTMSSRSSLVGVPPGKWAISQPPPKIHGSPGWRGRTPRPRRGTRRRPAGRGARRAAGTGRRTARGGGSPGSREHHPPGEVQDLLRVREALPHLGSVPDRDDPVAEDRHGARPPARRVHRVDVGAGDHEVGGPGRLRHRAEDSRSVVAVGAARDPPACKCLRRHRP